jgi:predicted transcriptional regulator
MTVLVNENKSKRRDKLVIMAEIIGIAKNGTSKTHIMFKANLSFSQLNQYLTILSLSNLIEKSSTNGREIYKSTQKGLQLMEKQYEIINLINKNNSYHVKSSPNEDFFSRSNVIFIN